ncbi:hypothetical protein IJ579_07205 [bacterium]|nr:hypothetical protein [bacterium]
MEIPKISVVDGYLRPDALESEILIPVMQRIAEAPKYFEGTEPLFNNINKVVENIGENIDFLF